MKKTFFLLIPVILCVIFLNTSEVNSNKKAIAFEKNLNNKLNIIELDKLGVLPDNGKQDQSEKIQKIVRESGQNYILKFSKGIYRIDNSIVFKDIQNVSLIGDNTTFIGSGKLDFLSSLETPFKLENIRQNDNIISSTYYSPIINSKDFVIISGNLSHDLYKTPYISNIATISQITNRRDNSLFLDNSIPFNINNAIAQKILNPYTLNINNINTSIGIEIQHCIGGNIAVNATGQSWVNIQYSSKIKLDTKFENDKNTIQLQLHYSKSLNVKIVSKNSGDNLPLIGMKVLRSNGLINSKINGNFSDSFGCEMVVYGGRNLNVTISSNRDGLVYRYNNIYTGNRNNGNQFAGCDNVTVQINKYNTDDQALEFHTCYNCQASGIIRTLKNSSEGAIVIKGQSQNIKIINMTIYSNNNFGIKLECQGNLKNIKIISCHIFHYGPGNIGINIRDASQTYDANIEIYNTYIEAIYPIQVSSDVNNIKIYNCILKTRDGQCFIANKGNNIKLNNILCLNTTQGLYRAIVLYSSNNQIYNIIAINGIIALGENAEISYSNKYFDKNTTKGIYLIAKNKYLN